ncbi:MAG: TonB-dependent receptor [Sinobacteraceae bacterium]|nr:TonB-dependent receptor [Nevskiaceae bacterium]
MMATASAWGEEAVQSTAANPVPAAESGDSLEEIVVTAQRRSEPILSVPLAISAATGGQLHNSGITEVAGLQFTTPGFLPEAGTGFTQIYLRGIGNNIFLGADPSVVTFIDDVPRIYGSMVNTLTNVERVEVLKGAQGGLYGRNATGGVVNIITRQPGDELEADGHVSYGTMSTFEAAAYLNLPLSDKVAWNLSAQRDTHSGYVQNLAKRNPYTASMFPADGIGACAGQTALCSIYGLPGTPQQTADFFNSGVNPPNGVGRQDFYAVDSKLRVQFTDDFKLTIDGDYAKKNDDRGDQWFTPTPQFNQAAAAALLGGFGFTTNFPAGFFPSVDHKFTTYKSVQAFADLIDYGTSARAELTLPDLTLTSITAYRHQHQFYSDDETVSVVPTVIPGAGGPGDDQWFVYQEFRGVSSGQGPFHYLGGATYLQNELHAQEDLAYFPPLFTMPLSEARDIVRNWSVYGQIGYDFTNQLNLTVSGRYIHETNHIHFTVPTDDSASQPAHKFVPSATASYKLADGVAYLRYANGFKSGGINPIVPPSMFPAGTPGSRFGPEKVDTFEAGYRAALLDHKVQFTSAIFYNRYTGVQTLTTGNLANPQIIEALINAGSARTYGAEASINWRVVPSFTAGLNAGYLDAKYKNFSITNSDVLAPFDFSGRQMVYAPDWQIGITGNLDQPINDKIRLVGSVLTSYISRITMALSAIPEIPDAVQPGYWITNLRLGIRTADDRIGIAAYANNLFDRAYTTFATTGSLGTEMVWGDPRIVGVEVDLKY